MPTTSVITIQVSGYICPSCGGVSLLDQAILEAIKQILIELGFISSDGGGTGLRVTNITVENGKLKIEWENNQ